MKIHEYQAKELLAAAGAAVPEGIVVDSALEAVSAFDKLGGGPVVLKAQIHAGGRGKGRFIDAPEEFKDLGGVKFLTQRGDIAPIAKVMLEHKLETLQTGPEGQQVNKLLVQAAADIDREIYLGMVLDRESGSPVLMGCAEGGVDIEEVAAKTPEKILKLPVTPEVGVQPFQARKMAFDLGFDGPQQIAGAVKILMALSQVFIEKDASLAEINPLIVTPDGEVLALDAKISFDENALFKHPDVVELRDLAEENETEVRAAEAKLSYIQLDGNIGCLVNGAGLAMATMDIIKHHGGEPANFLDVGGGVTEAGAIEAFRILTGDPKVKGILVNIFGGIARCDVIANALVKAGQEVGFSVPVVVRLEGTNVKEGREILAKSGLNLETAEGLTEAAQKVVAAAKG